MGASAAYLGGLSYDAENLGDSIASNVPAAANYAWAAAELLREAAEGRAAEYRAVHPEAPNRDGSRN